MTHIILYLTRFVKSITDLPLLEYRVFKTLDVNIGPMHKGKSWEIRKRGNYFYWGISRDFFFMHMTYTAIAQTVNKKYMFGSCRLEYTLKYLLITN